MSTYYKHADRCNVAENAQKEVLRVLFAIPENNVKGNHSYMDLKLGSTLPQKLGVQLAVHVLLLPDVFCSVSGDRQMAYHHPVPGLLCNIHHNTWEKKCSGEEPLSVVCCTLSIPVHCNKP